MLSKSIVGVSIFLSAVLASDVNFLDRRAGTLLCGQWDSELEGSTYYLENNLWGENDATSGSQCTQQTSVSGATVAWTTNYTWAGGPYNVKSYANLDLQVGLKKQISTITSIPSIWQWTYTSASSDLVADVSYDLWLSTSATGTGASSTSSYEIMIWLSSRGGAGPAGSQVGTVVINGLTWKLFQGVVSTWTVYSFVAPSELTSYSQDLLPFITYLCSTYSISTSQYLVQLQAGTEPFIGSAKLTTTKYISTVNSGTSSGTTTTTTKATTTTTKATTTTTKATTTSKTSTTTAKTSTTTAGSTGTVAHYGQCGGTGYTGGTVCVSPYVCTYSNDFYSQCV